MFLRMYNTSDCEFLAELFYQTVHNVNAKDYTKEQLDVWATGNVYYCLVLSEDYIRNHFADIKRYASVIENRLDDEGCTLESVLKDNSHILELAKKHNVNYVLIDDKYEIDINL